MARTTKPAANKPSPEKTAAEEPTANKPSPEETAANKPSPEKTAAKKPGARKRKAKAAAEGAAAERAPVEGGLSAEEIEEQLAALLRRLRKPRIAQVAGEIVGFAQTAGAPFARVAEELGVLERAAAIGSVELVEALLAAGVDPNAPPKDKQAAAFEGRALAAVFRSGDDIEDATATALIGALLAAGADPDRLHPRADVITNARRRSALDEAVMAGSRAGLELLAPASSAATRAHALNTLILRRAEEDPVFERMLELAPLDAVAHDGLFPLHAAAMQGDVALFERLSGLAKDPLPRLGAAASVPLANATGPGGGMTPTLLFPAGATPLAVARIVGARLQVTLDAYLQAGETYQRYLPPLQKRIDGCAHIAALLERRGAVDDAQRAPLPPALARVLAACTRLADSLGMKFAERARLIDPTDKGPFAFFQDCIELIRAELEAETRARLEEHLVGKFVTGAIERHVRLRDEREPLDELGLDTTSFYLWPEQYPEPYRELLERATCCGVNGDAVLCLERVEDTTKLWEISPAAGIDHGEVPAWVEAGVAALMEAR